MSIKLFDKQCSKFTGIPFEVNHKRTHLNSGNTAPKLQYFVVHYASHWQC